VVAIANGVDRRLVMGPVAGPTSPPRPDSARCSSRPPCAPSRRFCPRDAPHRSPHAAGGDHPHLVRPTLRRMRPLLAFTAMYVCVYAGEPIKYARTCRST
jgi:hypothetical protein